MAKNSGITKGKSHKEGGMPMTVKSTGQKIEVEGGEGIINKYVMSSPDKFEFEGKEKTSCEIISELNQKKGDGVSFECNTVENKKYKFKKGGELQDLVWNIKDTSKVYIPTTFTEEEIKKEIQYFNDYYRSIAIDPYNEWVIGEDFEKTDDGTNWTLYAYNPEESYAKGGSLNFDSSETFYEAMEGVIEKGNEFIDKHEYKGDRYGKSKLAVNIKLHNVNYGIDEALESYQTRRGNFDLEKEEYVKKDLRIDEEWVYEMYNTFLDDQVYFLTEDLLEGYGGTLDKNQLYQVGRMGGWLVFSDDGELNTNVDELETILNANFSAEGDLVGDDRWGYDMEPVTFTEFKEDGDYEDAVYYAKRINLLLDIYKEVAQDIKEAKDGVAASWKAHLDEKLDEHISENKKIKKKFRDEVEQGFTKWFIDEDDPDFAKGGKTQNEYKVEVLIDDEIDLGTNVFANSEDEAMDKAEELIRERNSKYEDSSIDIVDVVKINAKGGKIKLRVKNVDFFDKHYDEVGFTKKELSLPKQDSNKNWFTTTNDKSIAQQLISDGFVDEYAKGGKVKPRLKKGDSVFILGRRWFDKTAGNTYHTAQVFVNGDIIGKSDMEYGYDDQYIQTGKKILLNHYRLPKGMNENLALWNLRYFKVSFVNSVSDGLKRDLEKGGMADGNVKSMSDEEIEDEYSKILSVQILAGDIDENEVEELSILEKREFLEDKLEDDVERNEMGDEFVESCNVCGNDMNSNQVSEMDNVCKSCNYAKGGEVVIKTNRKGQEDGLLVENDGDIYHIVYSADFGISNSVMPYGIVMPNEDVVTFMSDRKAKKIWKILKPKVDTFLLGNYFAKGGQGNYAKGGEVGKSKSWGENMDRFINTIIDRNVIREFSINDYHDFRNKQFEVGVRDNWFKDTDVNFSKFDVKLGGRLNVDWENQGNYAKGGKLKGKKIINFYYDVYNNPNRYEDRDNSKLEGEYKKAFELAMANVKKDKKEGTYEFNKPYAKGGVIFYDIYDDETNKTLYIKAHSLEEAEGIAETLDWDSEVDGNRVDVLDDMANYEAMEDYAKGGKIVWVGDMPLDIDGREELTQEEAERLAKEWKEKGYDDVIIEEFAKGGSINKFGMLSFSEIDRAFGVDLFELSEDEQEEELDGLREDWENMEEEDRMSILEDLGYDEDDYAKGGSVGGSVSDLEVTSIKYQETRRGISYIAQTNKKGVKIVNDGFGGATFVEGVNAKNYRDLTEQRLESLIDDYESKNYAKGGRFDGVKPEYKALFKKYLKQEDGNQHTENALMIVKEFGTEKENERMVEIKNIHEKEGHLPYELYTERYEISQPHYAKMFYAKGGEVGKYSIIVWETEEDRDAGESFVAEILTNKKEALEKAEKMYYKQDFSAIEVIDENDEVILHLSSNEEFFENTKDYAKGGKITGVGKSGLDKIKKTSKDNPTQMYKVTDDNYSNIGNFYLKNGKFAKMTVSNADYDFAYNKVSLRPKRDVIYKATEIEGKGGYYAKGGKVSRLEALNKWKKMTDQERSNKISRLYPKLSRVEALNKFQKLTDKERSDKVASLYAKGGVIPEVNLSKITELVSGICSDLKI